MNWKKLLDALIEVETHGDNNAVGDNGKAFGVLQTHLEVILDVNKIYGVVFLNEDRLDIYKSRVICVLYVTWYCRFERIGREATSQDYALCWHYGPSFRDYIENDKDHYWEKVSKYIN